MDVELKISAMKKVSGNQPHNISRGVTYESFLERVQFTFNTVVKPQVEAEQKLSAEQKKVVLSTDQKVYANCLNPY